MPASQLTPRNGAYDIRITAELWETHFFDHMSLLVVDHPAETEVFVDERFSPAHPPSLDVNVMGALAPVAKAWDERGQDVTELVTRRDGRYLASFAKGAYQGIAKDHFVEFEWRGPAEGGPDSGPWSPAAGSIRPTAASTWRSVKAAMSRPAAWLSRHECVMDAG